MSKYVILSDIHGNLPALEAVTADAGHVFTGTEKCIINKEKADRAGEGVSDTVGIGGDIHAAIGNGIGGIFLLGDLIDYGMQSNEVVSFVRDELEGRIGVPIIASVWGNHERVCMMFTDFEYLSSQRTVASARYTASILTDETKTYIDNQMERTGMAEIGGRASGNGAAGVDGCPAGDDGGNGGECRKHEEKLPRILLVHGSLNNPYFGTILPEDVQGDYHSYDLVLSGHSHFPHVFTRFYPCEDECLRNKKPTVFINPGSVGQPRNRNPLAQYAIWDSVTGQAELRAVPYDVEKAMSMYHGQIDDFYRDRLQWGI